MQVILAQRIKSHHKKLVENEGHGVDGFLSFNKLVAAWTVPTLLEKLHAEAINEANGKEAEVRDLGSGKFIVLVDGAEYARGRYWGVDVEDPPV